MDLISFASSLTRRLYQFRRGHPSSRPTRNSSGRSAMHNVGYSHGDGGEDEDTQTHRLCDLETIDRQVLRPRDPIKTLRDDVDEKCAERTSTSHKACDADIDEGDGGDDDDGSDDGGCDDDRDDDGEDERDDDCDDDDEASIYHAWSSRSTNAAPFAWNTSPMSIFDQELTHRRHGGCSAFDVKPLVQASSCKGFVLRSPHTDTSHVVESAQNVDMSPSIHGTYAEMSRGNVGTPTSFKHWLNNLTPKNGAILSTPNSFATSRALHAASSTTNVGTQSAKVPTETATVHHKRVKLGGAQRSLFGK
jgi:hypothetical protein